MTATAYPATLPTPVRLDLHPAERRGLSTLADGPEQARARSRDWHAMLPVEWVYTRAQLAAFDAWGADTLAQWTRWFAVTLPGRGGFATRYCRFVARPRWEYLGRGPSEGLWRVSGTLEVRGRGVAPTGAELDEHWASVVLLIHAEGANGSTTVTDQRGHACSLRRIDGNQAEISTASPLCGISSIDLKNYGPGAGVLIVSGSADFAAPGAMTLEFKHTPGSYRGNNGAWTLAQSGGSGAKAAGDWTVLQSAGALIWRVYTGASTYVDATAATWPSAGVIDVAATRDAAGYLRIYTNGSLRATSTATAPVTLNDGSIAFGGAPDSLSGIPNIFADGKYDEIRLTVGVDRYGAADYTPRSTAFPDA